VNARERFLATVRFKPVDRYPYWEMGIWGQTYERWLREGLSEDDLRGDWFRGEPKFAELDKREFIPLNFKPIPSFEKIIGESKWYVIFRDEVGKNQKSFEARNGAWNSVVNGYLSRLFREESKRLS